MIDINFSSGCLKTFVNYGLSHSRSVSLLRGLHVKADLLRRDLFRCWVRFPTESTFPQLYSTINTLPFDRPKMKMRQSSICHYWTVCDVNNSKSSTTVQRNYLISDKKHQCMVGLKNQFCTVKIYLIFFPRSFRQADSYPSIPVGQCFNKYLLRAFNPSTPAPSSHPLLSAVNWSLTRRIGSIIRFRIYRHFIQFKLKSKVAAASRLYNDIDNVSITN